MSSFQSKSTPDTRDSLLTDDLDDILNNADLGGDLDDLLKSYENDNFLKEHSKPKQKNKESSSDTINPPLPSSFGSSVSSSTLPESSPSLFGDGSEYSSSSILLKSSNSLFEEEEGDNPTTSSSSPHRRRHKWGRSSSSGQNTTESSSSNDRRSTPAHILLKNQLDNFGLNEELMWSSLK